MILYLIRHTSVGVPSGMCYGQTDVPLNDSFEQEAEIVKQNLNGIQPDAVFSSPLSRCTRLADFCGYNPALDKRLMEMNFGDWEGKMWDEIDMSVWENDWVNPTAPGGESFRLMHKRIALFFDQLAQEPHKTVLIFTHGGVINCAHVYFDQTDFQESFELKAGYGEIVRFES